MPRAVVLVEGTSDLVALETLALRRGRDLEAEGVLVEAIGGAQAIRRAFARHDGARLVGLVDAGEADGFRRVLDEVFVCDPDLEGELIRALGADRAVALVDPSFATLQKQPAWRGMPLEDQLRRYLSGRSGNKLRYARLFVEALEVIPAPLQGVLEER
jgi:hypothetical protein